MINYGFTKELAIPFADAVKAVTEALKKEGFGILTTIDVREKFKEKLGVDFPNYIILGACNPPNAHNAILAEEYIGLMLPCNVIVFEKAGKTVVGIIKPTVAMGMIDNKDLKPLALTVEAKLKNVIDSLG